MRLIIVEPAAVPGCWERIRAHVHEAIARDETRDEGAVYADLRRGLYRAFLVEGDIDGAVIAADNVPDFRICYVGGRISPPKARNIATLIRALENVAVQLSCTSIVISGRLGWLRYLSPLGFARIEDDGPLPQFRKAL